MKIDIEKTILTYKNIENSYNNAYIGMPKQARTLKDGFVGLWKDFLQTHANFSPRSKLPLVLFAHGSTGLSKSKIFQSIIPKHASCIFFAPNSFSIPNRPTYTSPASREVYEQIHQLRQAEIHLSLQKLLEFDFIDHDNIFLMGHSEGALAVAIFKSKDIKGRIVTGFGCENSYFCNDFELGSQQDEPFLNIIGTQDQFFGRCSKFNKYYNIAGHGGITLQDNKNAKIILLGNTPHDITQSIYSQDEIISFLNLWIHNDVNSAS